MINIVTKDALAQAKPTAKNKPGFRLIEHLRFLEQSPGRTVVEFVGIDTVPNIQPSWYRRVSRPSHDS